MRHRRLSIGLASLLAHSMLPAQAAELADGFLSDQPFELRGHLGLQENVRLGAQTSEGASVRSDDLRRARLGLTVRWREDWIAAVSVNLAHRASLRDLWLEYRGWPVRITAGRFPEPFGLGSAIGSFNGMVPARASATLLGPDYGAGVGLNYRGERWAVSLARFTRDAGPTLSGHFPEDASTARVTVRPVIADDGYLHLGASYSARRFSDGTGVQLFGSAEAPLTRGLTPRSALQAGQDSYTLTGLESIVRWRSLMLLGEAVQARVAASGPTWTARYLEAAWSLTGEQRAYSTRYGAFGPMTPDRPVDLGGLGAWELAARWSDTDLSAAGGDRGSARSVALNWYLSDPVRISLVGQHIRLEPTAAPARVSSLGMLQLQIGL